MAKKSLAKIFLQAKQNVGKKIVGQKNFGKKKFWTKIFFGKIGFGAKINKQQNKVLHKKKIQPKKRILVILF